jgi:hypothetical protein
MASTKVQVDALFIRLTRRRNVLSFPVPTQHFASLGIGWQLDIPISRTTRRCAVDLGVKWLGFSGEVLIQQSNTAWTHVGSSNRQAQTKHLSRLHLGDLALWLTTTEALAVGRLEIIDLVSLLANTTGWRGRQVSMSGYLVGKRR